MNAKLIKSSSENGKKPPLNEIQRARWENTYKLVLQRPGATEEEASDFAYRKVAIADQIERELARSS